MPGGRPRKHARNTARLRNQSNQTTVPDLPNRDTSASSQPSPPQGPGDENESIGIYFDSMRLLINDDAGIESELEESSDSMEWDDEDLQERMYSFAMDEGDDLADESWLPPELKKRKKPKIGKC
jgi:hypothetical protein